MGWWSRRFYEFRNGFGTYIGTVLTVISFITLTYSLLVEKIKDNFPILQILFPTILEYAIVSTLIATITGILLGRVYLKRQTWTDQVLPLKYNEFNTESTKAWFAMALELGAKVSTERLKECLRIISVDPDEFEKQVYSEIEEMKKKRCKRGGIKTGSRRQ
jgi:hypothetical protein